MKSLTMTKSVIRFLFLLLFLLLSIELIRLIFLFNNKNFFPNLSLKVIFQICLYGLRFDLVIISLFMPMISVWFFIPWTKLKKKFWRYTLYTFFVIYFIVLTIPSLIDIAYFSYNNKRLTFDVFDFVGAISSEFQQLIPRFLHDFWWIFILFLLLIMMAIFIFSSFYKNLFQHKIPYWKQCLTIILLHVVLFAGARGSFGLRPLSILDASSFMGPTYSHAILNSTFTLVKTIGKKELPLVQFMSKEEAETTFPYCKQYHVESAHPTKNIVLIAVESLSSAYMGFFRQDGKTYTPFLDSLCRHSFVLPYSFCNAKRSIEGIPAILSSYPALSNVPLLTSSYATNCLPGLPHILKKHGYYTAFFHGGKKGTMMFDKYAETMGFQTYFSEADYDGPKEDYDGYWGIYDEPYLQFAIRKMNSFPSPFFSFIFTLSSHHPYTLPTNRSFLYSKEELPILPTIRYADFSLKKFFENARKQPWFKNTLFIITADHSAQMPSGCFQNFPFNMAIPIIVYDPSNDTLQKVSPVLAQQIDIFPSIVDYLGFSDTLCCFGNSFFSTFEKRMVLMLDYPEIVGVFSNGKYIRLNNNGVTCIYTCKPCMKYSLEQFNFDDSVAIKLVKAAYQQYVQRTNKNELCPKKTYTKE
jgi:phosphoglycerol transferase MdoB-like AlkP superfamily enzyme